MGKIFPIIIGKDLSSRLDSYCVDGKFSSKTVVLGETIVFDFQIKDPKLEVIPRIVDDFPNETITIIAEDEGNQAESWSTVWLENKKNF